MTDYTAAGYSADKVKARYVRLDMHGAYRFCEVGEDRRYDLRQGTVDEKDLPESVKQAAIDRAGLFPSYVEWPL